jgi:uncharacterized membrane protein YfcA
LGIGATARHLRERAWEWPFALFILARGVPGVVLGAGLILKVLDQTACIALGILTVSLGIFSWRRPNLGLEHSPLHRTRSGLLVGGLGLFIIEILNGSLISGSGLFVTMWPRS